jgi:hypothetical protein
MRENLGDMGQDMLLFQIRRKGVLTIYLFSPWKIRRASAGFEPAKLWVPKTSTNYGLLSFNIACFTLSLYNFALRKEPTRHPPPQFKVCFPILLNSATRQIQIDIAISQSNDATLASSTPVLHSFYFPFFLPSLSFYCSSLFLSSLLIDFMSHFHIKDRGGKGRVK